MGPQCNAHSRRRSVFGKTLWILLAVAGIVLPLDAESKRPPFKVALIIKAKDQDRTLIASYLGRQLRGLHDVTVTDDSPEYEIEVLAMHVLMASGQDVGLVLSTAVYYKSDGTDPSLGKMRYSNGHYLNISNSTIISDTCAAIIADFDQESLEPVRKIWAKVE